VNDYGFRGSCGNMSNKTFMHIGFTGTCVCIDPVNELWSVILTNRVYDMGSSDAVKAMYQQFHNEMLSEL
jgi:CubicO group peptidase (beta-lactamase class C family)